MCRPVFTNDQGNILLLGIGFIGICLLALAVITDASSAFIQHRNLQAQADSLALAGAQGIDLDQYYQFGASEATRLNPGEVREIVYQQLAATDPNQQTDMRLTSTEHGVFVTLSAPLRLTFFDSLPFDPIYVSAAARLDYRAYTG